MGDPIAFEPCVSGIAHDRENPGAQIPAAKSCRKPDCAHVGLLHHVLGVVIVTNQPSREVVRSIHMGEEGAVEIDSFGFVGQSRFFRSPSSFSFRLRARPFYSRPLGSLNRGNFLLPAESCSVKALISARRLGWKPNLIADRSCASPGPLSASVRSTVYFRRSRAAPAPRGSRAPLQNSTAKPPRHFPSFS